MARPSITLRKLEALYDEMVEFVTVVSIEAEGKYGGKTPPEVFESLEGLKGALRIMRTALDSGDEAMAIEIAHLLRRGASKRGEE